MKILISSCLLGEPVRYDGNHNILSVDVLKELKTEHQLFSFCPEVEGGLDTPRVPAEILKDKVINQSGEDVTQQFEQGANKALALCQKENIKVALLKAKSPSCGSNKIYDGTFSKVLVNENGITAKKLLDNGIAVFNEEELENFLIFLDNTIN